MSNQYNPISLKAAVKANYLPLAGPYSPEEYHLMDRAVRLLEKDGPKIDYQYVLESDDEKAISVFRKTSAGVK